MFIGGSNIGDYYLDWQDSNLRVEGDLGDAGHRLYDFIVSHAIGHQGETELDLDHFWVGDAQAFLTVPGKRQDIADNLLDLIVRTDDKVYFRNWYFLPNKEFMNTMMAKLAAGVGLKVLFSHRSRVPIIDIANHTATKILVREGAEIFRYNPRFMHSKVTWNSNGEVIFGSANLDDKALKGNFEFCIRFKDRGLAQELTRHFYNDLEDCHPQTREVVEKRALPKRAFSRLLTLATPLL
jgi:cardiolipin synthase